ncbi:hypothetical protein K503DRAFT_850990 [Rhizopogon vinicolor AM-OR11-026]|uniref:Uncharacterized protein n=1 Tax=Rhizopogon vinicolor AM-OR11-026 TaxID=1314800 RepID=A0A1B7MUE0_9AGAM|nr:hypothetical protein K503DRAFT_850990 [Rhizopogon vinicolor AM-OR11-026]
MRLSILPVLIAGAGIVSQVSAEPIRVIESSNANANIRFGHALANANVNGNDDSDNVVHLVRPTVVMTTTTEIKGKGRHFCGASLKEKALRMSNAFRHALGLPVIEMGDHDAFKGEVPNIPAPITGEVRILPMPFIGAPITPSTDPSEENHSGDIKDGVRVISIDGEPRHRHHHHHHHHPHDMKHKKAGTFFRRVHRAIMALGRWEGRAVAFVLGCGIGVLIRMFWVMSVLAYRTIRGDRTEEDTLDHGYIMFEHDAENIFVAPPEYTDEKVKVAEVEAQEIEARA